MEYIAYNNDDKGICYGPFNTIEETKEWIDREPYQLVPYIITRVWDYSKLLDTKETSTYVKGCYAVFHEFSENLTVVYGWFSSYNRALRWMREAEIRHGGWFGLRDVDT